jgi:integrase
MYDSSHLMVRNALRIGGSTSVSSFGLRLGYRFQTVLSIIQDSHEVNRARRDSCLIHRRGGGLKARAAAGRPDLRWHDLRHSGAVLAAATGASIAELMARLGHSTPTAAMRYQHAAQGRDREIAALLSKLANG